MIFHDNFPIINLFDYLNLLKYFHIENNKNKNYYYKINLIQNNISIENFNKFIKIIEKINNIYTLIELVSITAIHNNIKHIFVIPITSIKYDDIILRAEINEIKISNLDISNVLITFNINLNNIIKEIYSREF